MRASPPHPRRPIPHLVATSACARACLHRARLAAAPSPCLVPICVCVICLHPLRAHVPLPLAVRRGSGRVGRHTRGCRAAVPAAASAHNQAPPAVRGAGSRGGHHAPPLEANLRRHGHATLGRVRRLCDARGRRADVPRSRPTALSTSTRLYAAVAWAWADGRVQSCGDSIRYDSAQCTIACNVHLTGGGGRWRWVDIL